MTSWCVRPGCTAEKADDVLGRQRRDFAEGARAGAGFDILTGCSQESSIEPYGMRPNGSSHQ
eukprot:10585776-Heterocapsa_arctica.AAC.1